MTQTVIGVFDSYVDASSAQRALVDANFVPDDISVYSTATVRPVKHGPRAYAHGSSSMHDGSVASPLEQREQREQLEQLERLFARTFRQGEYPLETEFYREVIRRGGAIVSVDTSDAKVDVAQEAMTRRGAVDIDDLAAGWRRDDSLSRIMESEVRSQPSAGMAAASGQSLRSQAGTNRTEDPAADGMSRNMNAGPVAGPEARERANPHPAGGAGVAAVPEEGAGRAYTLGNGAQQNREAVPDPRGAALTGTTSEDEYSSYEDEFRHDYDNQYANTGSPYKDYQQAYRHGAAVGRDARYRDYDWPDVEADVRRNWETTYPDSGWDRFKVAVRHGWARVTGRE
ncbi:hypothetical protein A6V36_11935 [Paraburkholderia ginsengiterrae]|uniref:Uncharacterized protein n=1 Tax=Paraburkholderia ginsengiterrae TaxID=1462993 RepID=A0A1A9N2U8_9BURK|nr:hypothetical protein [Paraburkholderia ginsengiterrae]OAJ53070.1 hypothetical protein A6V36_11935 [Paraburkholderia ginsengiterrae]OAJ55768.1 hypothetical protein A6V37_06000 [Paraburkholderia ginsengiterrae]